MEHRDAPGGPLEPAVLPPHLEATIRGLEELMKGVPPKYLEKARAWFAAHELTSVATVKELGADVVDELLGSLGLEGKLASILLRNRLNP